MKRFFLTLFCGFAIFIVLFNPETMTNSVRYGIELNLYSVIPSLLPFMLLTNIMLKYNLCQYISYIFKPILSKLFKVSFAGCFAIIIGFTCGFPMGAKIIGDLYNAKQISKSESCYLITFCNNCSITFLLNYILFNCLGSEMSAYIVLMLVYLPPIITGIINKFAFKSYKSTNFCDSNLSQPSNFNPFINTVKSLSVLSIYIIIFTIIANLIAQLTFVPSLVKCVLAGITEITSGANYIAASKLNIPFRNYLVLASTVFGGFSIMFQSIEQVDDNHIKRYYVIGKLEQLLIFSILYFVFLHLSII